MFYVKIFKITITDSSRDYCLNKLWQPMNNFKLDRTFKTNLIELECLPLAYSMIGIESNDEEHSNFDKILHRTALITYTQEKEIGR